MTPCTLITGGTSYIGASVQQLIDTFVGVTGRPIARPPVAKVILRSTTPTTLALTTFGWQTEHYIARMYEDAWHWQSINPTGYAS